MFNVGLVFYDGILCSMNFFYNLMEFYVQCWTRVLRWNFMFNEFILQFDGILCSMLDLCFFLS